MAWNTAGSTASTASSALCQSRASGNLVKVHCSPKGTERQRSSAKMRAQRRHSADFSVNACPSKFPRFIPTGRDWKTRACLQIGNYYILFKHLFSAEEWRKLCQILAKRRRQSKLPDFRPMACTYAYCNHSLPS